MAAGRKLSVRISAPSQSVSNAEYVYAEYKVLKTKILSRMWRGAYSVLVFTNADLHINL